MSGVFKKLIEPRIKFIPVLDVVHCEVHSGVTFSIMQSVHRNVYNEFDQKLSNHLAATTGSGFPSYKVTVQIVDSMSKNPPQFLEAVYHESMPHALKAIAERAVAWSGPIELALQRGDCKPEQRLPVYSGRGVDSEYIKTFEGALGICNHLGATAFMDLSGEFDVLTITPPGGHDPVVLRLHDGIVEFPRMQEPNEAPFEWPISAIAERVSNSVSAQRYAASVRQAIVVEKEAAILAFHSAAEQRIHEFDSALAGRPLERHWRNSASALIALLRAGLGDTLSGISAGARGKALDWCAEIRAAREATKAAAARATNGSGEAPRATTGSDQAARATNSSGQALATTGSDQAARATNSSGEAPRATTGSDQAARATTGSGGAAFVTNSSGQTRATTGSDQAARATNVSGQTLVLRTAG